jgi:hypothetical protein
VHLEGFPCLFRLIVIVQVARPMYRTVLARAIAFAVDYAEWLRGPHGRQRRHPIPGRIVFLTTFQERDVEKSVLSFAM